MLERTFRFRRVAPFLALLTAGALVGCAYQPQFHAATPSADSEFVRVEFLEQDDDVFKFQVYSRSDEHLLIRRDEVFLLLGNERIARNPGGLKSVYDLPPGGAHDVFVAYDLARLEGQSEFYISFETAITAKGDPVDGPVLKFRRTAQ